MQDVKVDRYKYLGGSDIPIIMGISPFKTRFDLLLEKAQLKEDDFDGNEFTEYGNVMEEKIRNYINSTTFVDEKDYFIEGKNIEGVFRAHTDGQNDTTILEIKTTSKIHENVNDYKVYLVQLLFYMEITKREYGKLAVYERPQDFNEEFDSNRLHIYMISKSDYIDLVQSIEDNIKLFLDDLEKVKNNPLITEEELMPTDLVNLSQQVVDLELRIAGFKQIEEERDNLKNKIREIMIEKGIKKWTTINGYQISNVEDGEDKEVQKFNESKFKEENEDLYTKYLETKTQKGKKGYLRITAPKEEK